MLHRLPAAPDAATALKERLDHFQSGLDTPMQWRPVTGAASPNAESTAAAIVRSTDEDGTFITYYIVATSGTLTCALMVEATEEYARANGDALSALMRSFHLVP